MRLLTDAAGAVANRYDYDSFGNLEAASYETVANPYAFTARERDAESGLMFYRARYYDPKIGRFISEDPIGFEGEDLNIYRYVFNAPTNLLDPTGTSYVQYKALTALVVTLAIRSAFGAAAGYWVSGGTTCGVIFGALAGAASPFGGFLAAAFFRIGHYLAQAAVVATAQGAAAFGVAVGGWTYCTS